MLPESRARQELQLVQLILQFRFASESPRLRRVRADNLATHCTPSRLADFVSSQSLSGFGEHQLPVSAGLEDAAAYTHADAALFFAESSTATPRRQKANSNTMEQCLHF